MIVEETCPKCGHVLQNIVICTYPPIPEKRCNNCGWSWEGESEKVIRKPFVPPTESITYTQCETATWASSNNNEKIEVTMTRNNNILSTLALELSEHFIIPCDLCRKHFKTKDSCPTEIDKCNGMYHWRLLLKKISE